VSRLFPFVKGFLCVGVCFWKFWSTMDLNLCLLSSARSHVVVSDGVWSLGAWIYTGQAMRGFLSQMGDFSFVYSSIDIWSR
jgi:hypothetical protein